MFNNYGIGNNQRTGFSSTISTTQPAARAPQANAVLQKAQQLSDRMTRIQQFINDLKNSALPQETILRNLSTYFPAPSLELDALYETFAHKKTGNANKIEGRRLLEQNIRELLTIRDWDGNLLPEQLINRLSEQRDLYREIATLHNIGEKIELANRTGQQTYIQQALDLFKSLKGPALRSLCSKVYEIDSTKPRFYTADTDYGSSRISQDIRILEQYLWNGTKLLDCVIAENQRLINEADGQIKLIAHYQHNTVIPNVVRQSLGQEYMANLLRMYDLQDFSNFLNDPFKNTNNEFLLKKFDKLDQKVKDDLYRLTWLAHFSPNQYGFSDRMLHNDIQLLMRIQSPNGKNIIDQLINHYQAMIQFQENIFLLEQFAAKGRNCLDNIPALLDKFHALPQGIKTKLTEKVWWVEGGRFNSQFKWFGYGEWRVTQDYPPSLFQTGHPNAVTLCIQDLNNRLAEEERELFADLERKKSAPASPIPTEVTGDDLAYLPHSYRVAMVAAECSGVVSVGGLGPAIKGMAKALNLDGKNVRLILPKYENGPLGAIEKNLKEKPEYEIEHVWKKARVFKTKVEGMNVYLISDSANLFFIQRKTSGNVGSIYDGEYFDVQKRWAHFQSGAAELVYKMSKKENRPVNIVHVHDSQCALVPKILISRHTTEWLDGKTPSAVYTFHNNLVQQLFEGHENHPILKEIGLEARDTNSFIEGVIESDMVTTVSPQFALEAQTELFGRGVESSVKKSALQGKFVGIPNGGLEEWDPSGGLASNKQMLQLKRWTSCTSPRHRPIIDLSYGPDTPDLIDKIVTIKQELCAYLRLKGFAYLDPEKPIVLYVGRYDVDQKGINKLYHLFRLCQEKGCQLVCIGAEPNTPEAHKIIVGLKEIVENECGKIGALVLIDEKDADGNYIYQGVFGGMLRAAANANVVPSLFEPFGLVSQEALMAGKKVIGTKVGGTVNIVITEGENRNGYLFERHPDWNSREQNAYIAQTMNQALDDLLIENYLMFHGEPEEKDLVAYQMRMRMHRGLNSTWEKSPDGSSTPVQKIEMAYGRAFKNRAWRGRQQADLRILDPKI